MITIDRDESSPACVAHIRGDVDFAVVPELREALDDVIGSGCANVVLDLTEVTYADSSALGLLVWIDKRLQPFGGKLVLAGADPNVSRVLELSGLIGVAPSVSAATSVKEALGGIDLSVEQSPALWIEHVESPAEIADMSRLRGRIISIVEPLGMPEPDVFDLKVAVGEALANAVRHGSPGGQTDTVTAEVFAYNDRVEVLISDAGHGFDGHSVCGDDVYASGGRGVIFMRALTDRVDFLPCDGGGTTVRLVKRLPAAGTPSEGT